MDKDGYTLEWHSTPQLWVAYRWGCGCVACPKGFGKTQEEAMDDLDAHEPQSQAEE